MPAIMPTGVVIAVVTSTIRTVPTSAFISPPPSLPGAGVVSVKMAQFSAPIPLTVRVYKIHNRKKIPNIMANTDRNIPSR